MTGTAAVSTITLNKAASRREIAARFIVEVILADRPKRKAAVNRSNGRRCEPA